MSDFELLSPAGDELRLRAACRYGADAVYLGGPQMQLRAAGVGFTMERLGEAAGYVHRLGKRMYVAVNAFARNADIDAIGDYARALNEAGADAVIVSDLGALVAIKRAAPDLAVHISTQANCMNYEAARAYYDLGASRIVLAREMTLEDIAALRAKTPPGLRLEAFVHGAMCMAYSGRCMISAYLTGRSANRGACAQSCRWNYRLCEEKRPGQFFSVEEDARGMAILSAQDLCALPLLNQLKAAGVTSFKIEGRMKTAYYVSTVTNAYRCALDGLASEDALLDELNCVSHRPYCEGFYLGALRPFSPEDGAYQQSCLFVGEVEAARGGLVSVRVRNKISAGDTLEALSPGAPARPFRVEAIYRDGQRAACAPVPDERVQIECPLALEAGDILRRRLAGADGGQDTTE